jgi:hypothetical protein
LGQSLNGRFHDSYPCFKLGLLTVYSNMQGADDKILKELYSQVRCGMFHRGFAKGLVRITRDQAAPIVMHGDGTTVHSIMLNPWALLNDVEAHVVEHCAALRDPTDPRRQKLQRSEVDKVLGRGLC